MADPYPKEFWIRAATRGFLFCEPLFSHLFITYLKSFQNAAAEDDSVSSCSSDSMATLMAKKMSMSEEAMKTFRETTGKAKAKTEEVEEEEKPKPKHKQTPTTAAAAAEGFVVVSMEGESKSDSTASKSNSNKSCRDGYTWARRLVFR